MNAAGAARPQGANAGHAGAGGPAGPAGAPRRWTARSLSAAGLTIFAVALTVSGQALGNEPGARGELRLTLEGAISFALKNNRRLVNARLDREVQRFSLRVSENRFRPHVTVGPYAERTGIDPGAGVTRAGVSTSVTLPVRTGGAFGVRWSVGGAGDGVPSSERYSGELRFTFRQPLLRGAGIGVNSAPVEIARRTEESNVLALKQAMIDIVSSVIGRYLAQMQAARRVEIHAESLRRARDLLAVNEELVRTGRMARRDIVQTEADIAKRELELIATRNALDAARLAMADILDIDEGTRFRPADTLADLLDRPESKRPDAAGGVGAALRNRPDYLRALLGVRNAESRVMVAGNERLWDLSASVTASFGHAGDDVFAAAGRFRNTDYGVRLELKVPLGPAAVDPGEKKHLEAAIGLRKAHNDLMDLRQRVDIEVSGAVREVERSERQIELARSVRELAEEKTEIEREKLRVGLSSNFRLAEFEDDLVAAENGELDAAISHLGALASLDRVLGTTLESRGIRIVGAESGTGR